MHESFGTYVAQVAEISLRPDGRPKVERVVCAVDCGIAVNPDIIRAQIEGGIGFGLGAILKGEITLEDGLVEQGNFDGYQVLTIDEMPEVEVHIVPSTEQPHRRRRARRAADRAGGRQRLLRRHRQAGPGPALQPQHQRDRLTRCVCALPARGRRPGARQAAAAADLQPPEAFAGIADESARSVALFTEAGKVLQHPRCVNCHPAGDRPLQGEDAHLHIPAVQRGDGGIGVAGLRCTTCHQTANYDPAGVPGHPEWHLAPIEMAWAGKSLAEICAADQGPRAQWRQEHGGPGRAHGPRLAGRLGLGPGAGREPAPGTQAQFGALIAAWADTGARLPARVRPGGRPAHNSELPLCA